VVFSHTVSFCSNDIGYVRCQTSMRVVTGFSGRDRDSLKESGRGGVASAARASSSFHPRKPAVAATDIAPASGNRDEQQPAEQEPGAQRRSPFRHHCGRVLSMIAHDSSVCSLFGNLELVERRLEIADDSVEFPDWQCAARLEFFISLPRSGRDHRWRSQGTWSKVRLEGGPTFLPWDSMIDMAVR